MSRTIHRHAAFPWIALILTTAFLLLCSCGEDERHRVLTFFFDGVSPLAGETSGSNPSAVDAVAATDSPPTNGWRVHKPLNNCVGCHGSRRERTVSRRVQLVADVPQLCHTCHQEYAALKGWVHGPVAAGECLTCHEPHKARNEFLLVKPVPQLCYDCHDSQSIRAIDGHGDESHARCNRCHEGHAGANSSLLKPTFPDQPAG